MSNVSNLLYRELSALLPELSQLVPYERISLSEYGLPEINAVAFDNTPERISFILSRHVAKGGRSIANPCFEIALNPELRTANVVTYKDEHYFHEARPSSGEAGTMAQVQANRRLFHWLSSLKRNGYQR